MLDTTFIDELASSAPTPGGGGASAYCGALGAAAAAMVGNLTLGKKTYADVEDEVKQHLEALAQLQEMLIALVDADAKAFGPLAAAYRMPKDTPEQAEAKRQAVQLALAGAAEAPITIMRTASAVVDHADFLAHHGSRLARSDIGTAVSLISAAVEGASLYVFANVAAMEDEELATRLRTEAEQLAATTRARCDELFEFVKQSVS